MIEEQELVNIRRKRKRERERLRDTTHNASNRLRRERTARICVRAHVVAGVSKCVDQVFASPHWRVTSLSSCSHVSLRCDWCGSGGGSRREEAGTTASWKEPTSQRFICWKSRRAGRLMAVGLADSVTPPIALVAVRRRTPVWQHTGCFAHHRPCLLDWLMKSKWSSSRMFTYVLPAWRMDPVL